MALQSRVRARIFAWRNSDITATHSKRERTAVGRERAQGLNATKICRREICAGRNAIGPRLLCRSISKPWQKAFLPWSGIAEIINWYINLSAAISKAIIQAAV